MLFRRDVDQKGMQEMSGRSAWIVVFYHRNDATESKMTRELMCFTSETALGGHEGRWCQTVGYARLRLAMVGYGRNSPHCNGGSQVCGADAV